MRQALEIQVYNFKTECVKGYNNVADLLSKVNLIKDEPSMRTHEEKQKILKNTICSWDMVGLNNMNFNSRKKYKWKETISDTYEYVIKREICRRDVQEAINTKKSLMTQACQMSSGKST